MALSTLFTDIADAIREKDGSAGPIIASQFPERIRAISGGAAVPLDPAEVYKNTRPEDWLPMPVPQDNEMYLLFHIPDGCSSLLAFTATCTGSYTVALGTVTNGAFVQQSATSVASGEKYEAELFASDHGDLTSDGFKQVMIKVSGTDILTWEPSAHSKKTGPSDFSDWNIMEISCELPKGTKVTCGNSPYYKALKRLRYFLWSGANNATDMSYMFNACYSLVAIPELDTSKVTNMSYMFSTCYSLAAVPELDTSKVTNMSYMFKSCYSLAAIPGLDTSKATNTSYMFNACYSLVAIPELDTSKVTNMSYMFNACYSLITVPELDTSKVSSADSSFTDAHSLAALKFNPSVTRWYGQNISLTNCSLGHEAIVGLFNSLPTITSSKTLKLTGNPGVPELTDEEKAIAASKKWTLSL